MPTEASELISRGDHKKAFDVTLGEINTRSMIYLNQI
jgi:hypothetical protein